MEPAKLYDSRIEQLRQHEYPMLNGATYLDHAGTTLYARSLIEGFAGDLLSNLYGNPHSSNTPSRLAGEQIDLIRERALRWFNADPEHFDLVFTANCTAAIKIVLQGFRDVTRHESKKRKRGFWYGYHKDAHTSLVGVREAAQSGTVFQSDAAVDDWIDKGCPTKGDRPALFAFPGQSNMTGRRLPLTWPARIRSSARKRHVYTMLDAAALVTTSQLDFSDHTTAPDFTVLSFYKIFGYPDLGALIVRKESAHMLTNSVYFGGGTVEMVVSIEGAWHAKKKVSLHDGLEDGTLAFHSILALDIAMAVHRQLFGSMTWISQHTSYLATRLKEGLELLRHVNGVPLCRIYNDPQGVYADRTKQGATIAFNIYQVNGSAVAYDEVEKAADERGIYVRSGQLCNPGGVSTYLDFSSREMREAYAHGHRCTTPISIYKGKPTGVVRVSLGAMSTMSDVLTFLRFLEDTYIDRSTDERHLDELHSFEQPRHAPHPPIDTKQSQSQSMQRRGGWSKAVFLFHKSSHSTDTVRPASSNKSIAKGYVYC